MRKEKPNLLVCPECKLKLDMEKAFKISFRCPRCNAFLLKRGCDGNCKSCSGC